MPKGKPKAKNPELYEDEDPSEQQQRKVAPQAAPHRRGGTHRVKDEHRTGTHWDDKNYQELLYATKDAGLWRKDMPKWEMAKKLAENDRIETRVAMQAEREAKKKRKELEDKKKKEKEEKDNLAKEKAAKKKARERRRAAGDSDVSSTTESDEEPSSSNEAGFGAGQIVSDDDTWESSTTTTATHTTLSPIFPGQRLRIYEWPYDGMPPALPPRSPVSPSGRRRSDSMQELLPKKLPYAVMNVVTTITGETIELPGRQYPEEIGADFVPTMSEHAKDCARNGILYGPTLSRAIIERGIDWSARTQVQWWNGRMYFRLPARKPKASDLKDVYGKWKRKEEAQNILKRTKSGVKKLEPKGQARQKLRDQRQKMLDVFAASEYRPPICYVPSYLDYPLLEDDEEVEKSIGNLFYIRFPGMQLPHYYFWAAPGEWEDPTVPNPDWMDAEIPEKTQFGHEEEASNSLRKSSLQVTEKMRVRRVLVPRKFDASVKPPKTSRYKAALWAIERDLYHNGWANTMYVLRDKWLKEGKEAEWKRLISRVPFMYPSGNLPQAPPVLPSRNETSLAEKFAAVDVLNPQRPVQPIEGDEAWTRDDNAYWDIVDTPLKEATESDIQEELLRSMTSPTSPVALERRDSEMLAWIADVNSTSSSSAALAELPPTPRSPSWKRSAERAAWEELFLQNVEAETELVSEIEQMPVAVLKHNLYALSMEKKRRRSWPQDRCAICLQALDPKDPDAAWAHYETHRHSSNDICPFCDLPWNGYDSEMKASHIFCHDMDERSYHRRRSSGSTSGIQALYAVPKTKKRFSKAKSGGAQAEDVVPQPRRLSKVTFSPVTVEKRVAYNDLDDAGMEADVSSIATTSPRCSSMSTSTRSSKTPRKSALKVDVSSASKPTRVTKSRSSSSSVAPSRNSNGKKRTPYFTSDPTYQPSPSTPSTHVTSPEFHIARRTGRKSNAHPDATWDPRRYSTSGSEHVPSPYLSHVNKLPIWHPNASYDPRKYSKSSFESLEFYTGSRGPRKKAEREANKIGTGKAVKGKAAAKRGKTKAQRIQIGETPQKLQGLAPTGAQDTHRDSTVSNVSSASDSRRSSAVHNPDLDVIHSPESGKTKALTSSRPPRKSSTSARASSTSKKRKASVAECDKQRRTSNVTASSRRLSIGSRASPKTKRRKTSEGSIEALERRSSGLTDGDDYIAFINDKLLEDHSSDVLHGNPFAAPPSKSKKVKSKKKAASKVKISTPKEVALETKKAAESVGLSARRAKRAARKTTVLGRPHVEPLIIAPAKRLSKPNGPLVCSASTISSGIFLPPTPSSKSSSPRTPKTKEAADNHNRGRRSSAPTPSPSLTNSTLHRFSISTSATTSNSKQSPLPIDATAAKRKASYDVPFSEARPIVPPNTPATGLGKYVESEDEESGSPLDAGQLSDKIGKVKTTRRGLVRELPVGVKESVLAKGKARGRSVSKAKEREARMVVPKRKRMSEVEALAALKGVEKVRSKGTAAKKLHAKSKSKVAKKIVKKRTAAAKNARAARKN